MKTTHTFNPLPLVYLPRESRPETLAAAALLFIADTRSWLISTHAECCCGSVCHFLEMWPRMLDRYLNERTREVCALFIDINLN